MKLKIRFGLALFLTVISFSVIWLINFHTQSTNKAVLNKFICRVTGDQWIVTTTGFLNPSALTTILKTKMWKVLALGDKRTSHNWKENAFPSKVLYLSFEEQLALDFHLVRYISYGINAQKNVGYLVAILCGAKIIYELDSNSMIWSPNIHVYPSVQSSADVPWLAFQVRRSPFVNIYAAFGQPQLWPRGIPADELHNISEDGWSSLRRNDNETIHAYVQQKLFDFDPDVDAFTRLTRPVCVKHAVFDRDRRVIALEPFTFSPYNSRNTIYHQAAFWGLYLPMTTPPQVGDIWRGFWVQRLLWDIGGHLIFSTIRASKYERSKSTVQDMIYEEGIHSDGGKLVRLLKSWKTTRSTLFGRIQALIDIIVNS